MARDARYPWEDDAPPSHRIQCTRCSAIWLVDLRKGHPHRCGLCDGRAFYIVEG